MVLTGLGRHAAALASHDRAMALRPDVATAHLNRAAVLMHLKRPEDALASYDAAIALQPNRAEALQRGNVLGALQRHDDAIAAFRRAVTLRPEPGRGAVEPGAHAGSGRPHQCGD